MMKFGIISEVKPGFAKVAFIEDDFVSDFLPVLVRKSLNDKDSWELEVQEHVVCMMDDNCEAGVILGAVYSDSDKPDSGEGPGKYRKVFKDGSFIEFNRVTGDLKANVKGKATIEATGLIKAKTAQQIECEAGIKIKATAPQIELTGAVSITGALTVTGGIMAASIGTTGAGAIETQGKLIADSIEAQTVKAENVKSGTVDLKNHTHTGVQTGPGVSGPPKP